MITTILRFLSTAVLAASTVATYVLDQPAVAALLFVATTSMAFALYTGIAHEPERTEPSSQEHR